MHQYVKQQLTTLQPRRIEGSHRQLPNVIIADGGFGMEPYLMRPFPDKNTTTRQRIFNYRLSRARRISENAFGILSNRWRILLSRMMLSPEKATQITVVCCALHNMLCSRSRDSYLSDGFVDMETEGVVTPGLWRKTPLPEMPMRYVNNASVDAKIVREKFKDFFCEEGAVPWQNQYLLSC